MADQKFNARGARLALLAAALLALVALGACGQRDTLLAVNASATTRTAPDLAVVTLGVVARGDTARAAQQAQNGRMAAVMQAVRAAGAAEGDVQTVGFSLEPQYVHPRGGAPRISGYVSRNIIAIRIRDLNAVSALVDATVAEGANELQGIHFTFNDIEASREAARAHALQTARRRADTYAEAAGMKVIGIEAIIEPGSTLPPGRDGAFGLRAMNVSPEQASASQVSPGQLDNAASVTVVFNVR